jgi:hypothetical protein
MTDGLGSISYTYDTASRLTSESRTFSAITGHAPFQLSYEYTPSGALKKLTDPAGDSVTNEFDAVGQITDVNGSTFASVTNYASQIKYRAWGGQKSVKYGDTPNAATTTYDARMRPYEYTLNVPATPSTLGTSMRERFEYYADGRLKQMTDLDDRSVNFLGEPPADRRFSRRYAYDHAGRITSAVGVNAAGNDYYLPFRQSYTYDAFDNLTIRNGSYYYEGTTSDIAQYQSNRRQDWTYDNSGNVTHSPIPSTVSGETRARDWTYDSAGGVVKAVDTKTLNGTTTTKTFTSKYDGDGQVAFEQGEQFPFSSYTLRSTVMGGAAVTRLDTAGNKFKTNVMVDGLLTATQDTSAANFGGPASVSWLHKDPAGLSEVTTTTADKKSVYDPLGNYISYQTPPAPATGFNPFYTAPPSGSLGSGFGFNGGSTNVTCTYEGMPVNCGEALHALALGNAAPCPDNNCGAHWNGRAYQFPHFTSDGLFYGGVNAYWNSGNPPTLKKATPEERRRSHEIRARFGHNPFGELSAEEIVFDFIGFGEAYSNCLGSLGNNREAPAPGLNQAEAIMFVNIYTGVDPTLLAATWRYEGGFDPNSGFLFNPKNGTHNRARTEADIGPGQLHPGTWDKAPYTNEVNNPFGTNRQVGDIFNGSPMDNLIVTGRALMSRPGDRAHQAGLFRAGRQYDLVKDRRGKVIGKNENPDYRARADAFNGVAPNYDSFFNCLRKQGFGRR